MYNFQPPFAPIPAPANQPHAPFPTGASTNPVAGGQTIAPGTITYTTTTAKDGTITYHPFSYSTPSGVVSGIQWIPAEETQTMPQNAVPANASFVEAWNQGNFTAEDQKAIKEWQKAEEKRRKREDKGSASAIHEHSRSRSRGDPDAELRRARELDAMARERRKNSVNQGQSQYLPATHPAATISSVTPSNWPSHSTNPTPFPQGVQMAQFPSNYGTQGAVDPRSSTGAAGGPIDLNRQFAELDMGSRERKLSRPGVRRMSNVSNERPTVYPPSANTQPFQPAMPYATVPSAETSFIPTTASNTYVQPTGTRERSFMAPNVTHTTAHSYARSASPNAVVLPGGTSYQPPSRAASPVIVPGSSQPGYPQVGIPGYSRSIPDASQQQLVAPDGFIRPINPTLPYTPFEPMKVQEMDDFLDHRPQIPPILKHHDVYTEDWSRFMMDISLAWSGRLPVPHLTKNGHPPKRATLTADLIDLWNASFFIRRGVEVILYKGRVRRSGQNAGVTDLPMHLFAGKSVSSSSGSEDESDMTEDERAYGFYGRPTFAPGQGSMADVMAARRRRKAFREERQRMKQEKKARRREKAREKKYALYITCVRHNQSAYTGPQAMANQAISTHLQGLPGTNMPVQGMSPGQLPVIPAINQRGANQGIPNMMGLSGY